MKYQERINRAAKDYAANAEAATFEEAFKEGARMAAKTILKMLEMRREKICTEDSHSHNWFDCGFQCAVSSTSEWLRRKTKE